MKWIKYQIVQSTVGEETILVTKKLGHNEANLAIAQAEAYNGEYTIEDDSLPTENPYKVGVTLGEGCTLFSNRSKFYEALGFMIIDVSLLVRFSEPESMKYYDSSKDILKLSKETPADTLNYIFTVKEPQLNVAYLQDRFYAKLSGDKQGKITLHPSEALIEEGGFNEGDSVRIRISGIISY